MSNHHSRAPDPASDDPSYPGPLFRAEIIIWSPFDPRQVELDTLAREAMSGEAYCSRMRADLIADPVAHPNWDGTEFFG